MIRDEVETAHSLEEIREFADKFECVYVYGAGKWGTEAARLLRKWEHKDIFFVVSSKEGVSSEILGIPVLDKQSMQTNEKCGVIVAVSMKYEAEILEELKRSDCTNILRIKEIEYVLTNRLSEAEIRKRPKLEITPKIGCSVRCKYCPQDVLYHNYFNGNASRCSEIPLDDFKTCISHMPRETIISFAGFVEPFLHPQAVEMILYAADTGRKVELFTTLVGLDAEKFNRIKDVPFSSVVLHMPDQEGYANIPITDQYKEVLELMLETKKENGLPFIDFANCQSVPSRQFLDLAQGRVKIVDIQMQDRAGNLEDETLLCSRNKSGALFCEKSLQQIHWVLLPDSTVVLCCNDFGMKHILGNLQHNSFEEIRKGENYLNVRRMMMELLENNDVLCRSCIKSHGIEEYKEEI